MIIRKLPGIFLIVFLGKWPLVNWQSTSGPIQTSKIILTQKLYIVC